MLSGDLWQRVMSQITVRAGLSASHDILCCGRITEERVNSIHRSVALGLSGKLP